MNGFRRILDGYVRLVDGVIAILGGIGGWLLVAAVAVVVSAVIISVIVGSTEWFVKLLIEWGSPSSF